MVSSGFGAAVASSLGRGVECQLCPWQSGVQGGDCGGNVIAAANNLYDHKAHCGLLVKNGDNEGTKKKDNRLAAAGPARSPPQAPPRSKFTWRRDRSRPEGLLPGNPSLHAANVQQIVRFGYSHARAAEALLDTGGSVDRALVRLVNMHPGP